ncbi:unnamed protein product [Chironomus riparius]|uniref:Cytochrome P450 n=1 Tax=Chironomus riparius TaxID=315576 RepID=A0A9N9RP24_9DIPT|nr:unnamed protein product [Chironomus riparius]
MFVILAIVFIVILLYYFDRKQFTYWKDKGIPQLDNQTILIGDIKDLVLQRKSIAKFYGDSCVSFQSSPIVGSYFSYRPLIIINDLELAKTILATDFHYFHDRGIFIDPTIDPLTENLFLLPGEKWNNLRKKLTPLFSTSKLKMMLPIIQDSVDILDNYISDNLELDKTFITDIRDLSSNFNLTMISSIAYGTQNDCINEPNNLFRLTSLKVLDQNFFNNFRLVTALFMPKISKIFKICVFDKEVSKFFLDITKETIKYREETDINRNDFLQLFMQLKNEGLRKANGSESTDADSFTLNEVAANLFLFVIAGYETTSATISYCLYELAKNSANKKKVQAEIDELDNEEFSYEKISKLKYLENCVNETLRKYPVIPVLNRECLHDYRVPNTDLVIPKGTPIIVPVYAMQRNPELFENPTEFNPDRFDNKNSLLLSFGHGNRSCIGNRMSLIVIKTCLCALLSKYDVKLVSPLREIEFTPKIPSLAPTEKLLVSFSRRNKF